jgi:hypothetical protein
LQASVRKLYQFEWSLSLPARPAAASRHSSLMVMAHRSGRFQRGRRTALRPWRTTGGVNAALLVARWYLEARQSGVSLPAWRLLALGCPHLADCGLALCGRFPWQPLGTPLPCNGCRDRLGPEVPRFPALTLSLISCCGSSQLVRQALTRVRPAAGPDVAAYPRRLCGTHTSSGI